MQTRIPRRRVGRVEREQQILDAAVEVFTERGFQNASMDAVAERVGVTKPVLYTHFGSKDGLLLACIARARAELLEATTAAVAAADGAEDMMRSGIRAFFDYIDSQGPAWMIGYSEPMVAGAALEGVRAQQTDFLATLLVARKPDAEPEQLAAWAQIIVGACERLAIWRSTRDIPAEVATEYVMDLAWRGLGPDTPE